MMPLLGQGHTRQGKLSIYTLVILLSQRLQLYCPCLLPCCAINASVAAHWVAQWLRDTNMDNELVEGLLDYINAGGDKTQEDILDRDSPFMDYAREHDKLVCNCFLEGRVA
eukprot:scaffold3271_cov46-Cyclotella_meneghiniana.AAC.3